MHLVKFSPFGCNFKYRTDIMNPIGRISPYYNVPLQPQAGYLPPGVPVYKYYQNYPNNIEVPVPEAGHINPYLHYPPPPAGMPAYTNPPVVPPVVQSKHLTGYINQQQPFLSEAARPRSTPGGYCFVTSPPPAGKNSPLFGPSHNPIPKPGVSFTDLDFPKLGSQEKIRRKSECQTLEEKFKAKAFQYGIEISTKAEQILKSTSKDLPSPEIKEYGTEMKEDSNIDLFQKKASSHGIHIQCPGKVTKVQGHCQHQEDTDKLNMEYEASSCEIANSVDREMLIELNEKKSKTSSNRSSNVYSESSESNCEPGISSNQILHALSQSKPYHYHQVPYLKESRSNDESCSPSEGDFFSIKNDEFYVHKNFSAKTVDDFAKSLLSVIMSQVSEELTSKDRISLKEGTMKKSLYSWGKEDDNVKSCDLHTTESEEDKETEKHRHFITESFENEKTRDENYIMECDADTTNGMCEDQKTESVGDLRIESSKLSVTDSVGDRTVGIFEDTEEDNQNTEEEIHVEEFSETQNLGINDNNLNLFSSLQSHPRETKLNPVCPEFVPSPKHTVVSGVELITSSPLDPNSPVFHPQPVQVVHSHEESSTIRPDASIFQPSLHVTPHRTGVKMSKNSSVQTNSIILTDVAVNTCQTKQTNQFVETVSCDRRDVCVDTMETFELEDTDLTIPVIKKVSKATTTEQSCKSACVSAVPETCTQGTVMEESKDIYIKLLNTQRELLHLRAKVSLDEINSQLEHLKKYKHVWLNTFDVLNDQKSVEDIIDAKIRALERNRRTIPESVMSLDRKLNNGEFLTTVPNFNLTDTFIGSCTLAADTEQITLGTNDNRDKITSISPPHRNPLMQKSRYRNSSPYGNSCIVPHQDDVTSMVNRKSRTSSESVVLSTEVLDRVTKFEKISRKSLSPEARASIKSTDTRSTDTSLRPLNITTRMADGMQDKCDYEIGKILTSVNKPQAVCDSSQRYDGHHSLEQNNKSEVQESKQFPLDNSKDLNESPSKYRVKYCDNVSQSSIKGDTVLPPAIPSPVSGTNLLGPMDSLTNQQTHGSGIGISDSSGGKQHIDNTNIPSALSTPVRVANLLGTMDSITNLKTCGSGTVIPDISGGQKHINNTSIPPALSTPVSGANLEPVDSLTNLQTYGSGSVIPDNSGGQKHINNTSIPPALSTPASGANLGPVDSIRQQQSHGSGMLENTSEQKHTNSTCIPPEMSTPANETQAIMLGQMEALKSQQLQGPGILDKKLGNFSEQPIDPRLYDAVVAQIKQVYPQIASDPKLLNAVALEQTLILQWFVSSSKSDPSVMNMAPMMGNIRIPEQFEANPNTHIQSSGNESEKRTESVSGSPKTTNNPHDVVNTAAIGGTGIQQKFTANTNLQSIGGNLEDKTASISSSPSNVVKNKYISSSPCDVDSSPGKGQPTHHQEKVEQVVNHPPGFPVLEDEMSLEDTSKDGVSNPKYDVERHGLLKQEVPHSLENSSPNYDVAHHNKIKCEVPHILDISPPQSDIKRTVYNKNSSVKKQDLPVAVESQSRIKGEFQYKTDSKENESGSFLEKHFKKTPMTCNPSVEMISSVGGIKHSPVSFINSSTKVSSSSTVSDWMDLDLPKPSRDGSLRLHPTSSAVYNSPSHIKNKQTKHSKIPSEIPPCTSLKSVTNNYCPPRFRSKSGTELTLGAREVTNRVFHTEQMFDKCRPKQLPMSNLSHDSLTVQDNDSSGIDCVLKSKKNVPEALAAQRTDTSSSVCKKETDGVQDKERDDTAQDNEQEWQQVTKKGRKMRQESPVPILSSVSKASGSSSSISSTLGKEKKGNNFERLINRMTEIFDSLNREEIIDVIANVRAERGGLSGLTMKEIVEDARLVIMRNNIRKREKYAEFTERHGSILKNNSEFSKLQGIMAHPTNKYIRQMSMLDERRPVNEEICVICHDGLSLEENKKLDCGHVFHAGCIKQWVYGREMTCPTCRRLVLFPEEFPVLGR